MVEAAVPQISREELAQFARNKKHLHAVAQHNGYVMPTVKSPFVTLKNIERIRKKELWVPKKADVPEAVLCPRPPPKKDILASIHAELSRQQLALADQPESPAAQKVRR